ncbi:hypothetical protein [Streptomyces sp. NPDC059918]|uniref:hypothetical protein n=1 Tax=unclassified Streptomyces TaxID=2593676 RepID=UPI003651E3A4
MTLPQFIAKVQASGMTLTQFLSTDAGLEVLSSLRAEDHTRLAQASRSLGRNPHIVSGPPVGAFTFYKQEELDHYICMGQDFSFRPGAESLTCRGSGGGYTITLVGGDTPLKEFYGGHLQARGDARITGVSGGRVDLHDTSHITRHAGGTVNAHDSATIESVDAQYHLVDLYDRAALTTLIRGPVNLHGNSHIKNVSGGRFHAYETSYIEVMDGGEGSGGRHTRILTMRGGRYRGSVTVGEMTGGKIDGDEVHVSEMTGGNVTARTGGIIHATGHEAHVTALDGTHVTASNGATVMAAGTATVTAADGATVTASDGATVTATGEQTHITAGDDSHVTVADGARVQTTGTAHITALRHGVVLAYTGVIEAQEGSWVEAFPGGSEVRAHPGSQVIAYQGSHVKAMGGSITLFCQLDEMTMDSTAGRQFAGPDYIQYDPSVTPMPASPRDPMDESY